jgi:hypothetical protein
LFVSLPVVLVPAEPTELPEVSVLLEPLPIVLEPLEPWFAPLDVPMELLPELDPDLLVPDEPELGV